MDRHDDREQRLKELFSAARRVDRETTPEWNALQPPNPRRGERPRFTRRAAILTLATATTVVALFAATAALREPPATDVALVLERPRVDARPSAPPPPPTDRNATAGSARVAEPTEPVEKLKGLGYVAPTPPDAPASVKTTGGDAGVEVDVDIGQAPAGPIEVGDEFVQDLPKPGRYYQDTLAAPPVADPTVGASKNRSADFKATVKGVGNVDPLTGRFMSLVNTEPGKILQFAPGATEAGDAIDTVDSVWGELDSATGFNTEGYAHVEETGFVSPQDEPLSTFSIDVDTASYANVRRFLDGGSLPPKGAVRIEELINYFDYDYPEPSGTDPFSITVEVADCPWNPANRLARIGLKGRAAIRGDYPGSNLVFLVDVSGSMQSKNKLELLKAGLTILADQLDDRDTIALVTYAGSSEVVLESTAGSDTSTIKAAIARLRSGGGTHGAAGIRTAYAIAREHFIPGGVNRVILATDGDFNVGVTSPTELLDVIRKDADDGIFLTALGVGMGNYKDDTLERLADNGNGNYFYLDSLREARKVLVEELAGTLVTIAKDVKIQVEFNPAEVGAYRLIGYDNRRLANQDFNDDTKDAGEIGAGHTVTALYELIPPGRTADVPGVDPLRYRQSTVPSAASSSGELMTVKVRYKTPEGRRSQLLARSVHDEGLEMRSASEDLRFAAAVAEFGMVLRDSRHRGLSDLSRVVEKSADLGRNESRREFMELARRALDLGATRTPR